MRVLSTILLLVSLLPTFATVINVDVNGGGDFTTIQSAINASNNGDTLRVWPGAYYENINFIGHNITLESLYATTQDTSYISSTKIIGEPTGSAVSIINGETATISGLTIMNDEVLLREYHNFSGGGVQIRENSNVLFSHNMVKNCTAGSAGGVLVMESYVIFEANTITNCFAFSGGGGLFLLDVTTASFSSILKNDIFDNVSSQAHDVMVRDCSNDIYIELGLVSRSMNEADDFFFRFRDSPNTSLSTEESYLPSVNHDLFVAPWGSNTNDGLSDATPLQTIEYATRIIQSDSLEPKTIHLAAGTYSRSVNNQLFPFNVKSHSRMIGAGSDDTVLDIESSGPAFVVSRQQNVFVEGIAIINAEENSHLCAIECSSDNTFFRDILFTECPVQGLTAIFSDNLVIENVRSSSSTADSPVCAIEIVLSQNVIINNVISNDLHATGIGGLFVGLLFQDADVIVNNYALINSSAYESNLFDYWNRDLYRDEYPERRERENTLMDVYDIPRDGNPDGNLIANNMLFANNVSGPGDFFDHKVTIQNSFNESIVNNCTIANNNGAFYTMRVCGDAQLNNLLLYNPSQSHELTVDNDWNDTIADVELNYSLLLGGSDNIQCDVPDHFTYTGILDEDPLFLGSVVDTLSEDMIDYYQLAEGSPCINAGTPDTTGTHCYPLDLAGNWRVWDGRIDIGCFEYDSEPGVSVEEEEDEVPPHAAITAFPNPVNIASTGGTILSFSLAERPSKPPVVSIYNIRGQRVRSLTVPDNMAGMAQKAGVSGYGKFFEDCGWSVVWDGRNEQGRGVGTGVYLMSVQADGRAVGSGKCMVVK